MKSTLLFRSAVVALCGMAVPPLVQTLPAADVSTNELSVNRLPLDLARGSLGTQIQVHEPVRGVANGEKAAQALIGDDASRDFALAPGKTSFIVSLSKIEVLSHFNFIDNGAEGKMTVSVSDTKLPYDAAGWRAVGESQDFEGRAVIAADFGNVEGRYVKIDFETRTGGRIAGFGLFGMPVISAFRQAAVAHLNFVSTPSHADAAVASNNADRGSFYDYASLSMGAKVVAVSHADSLAEAQYMIDGNMATSFTFNSGDANPTAVIDLGTRRMVDKVTCVFEAPAGQLDFYLVENAYSRDDTQKVDVNYLTPPGVAPVSTDDTLNYSGKKVLSNRKPAGSVATTGEPGVNRVSVNLTGMEGRFLVAAFHRTDGSRHAGSADGKDFKDFKDTANDFKDKAVADNPVKVEGISAFGEPPTAQSIPLLPPEVARKVQNARPPGVPPNGGRVSP